MKGQPEPGVGKSGGRSPRVSGAIGRKGVLEFKKVGPVCSFSCIGNLSGTSGHWLWDSGLGEIP